MLGFQFSTSPQRINLFIIIALQSFGSHYTGINVSFVNEKSYRQNRENHWNCKGFECKKDN